MTPRQRWAVAWRTVRIAARGNAQGISRGYLLECARRGSGNTVGKSARGWVLPLDRSPKWFLMLSRCDPCSIVRDGWLGVFRLNLQHSRADRESWEALP